MRIWIKFWTRTRLGGISGQGTVTGREPAHTHAQLQSQGATVPQTWGQRLMFCCCCSSSSSSSCCSGGCCAVPELDQGPDRDRHTDSHTAARTQVPVLQARSTLIREICYYCREPMEGQSLNISERERERERERD